MILLVDVPDRLKPVQNRAHRAAKDQKITGVTRQFESALKNLDKVGKAFEITGKTIDGKEFDLKDLKGKVVLIDFWGTWCGPCVAEIPNIIRNYEKYHGKGFDVIGVSSDKQDDVVVQFLKAKGVPATTRGKS